jgi:hypothetical protein
VSLRASASMVASLSLLAAWTGIAVFIAAVVAPAAFAVLPTRALAGALVGRTLPVLFALGIVIGVLVVILNQAMDAGRMVTGGAAVLGLMCVAALMVEQRLRGMLSAIGAPMDSLAASDARRVAFGRLHGVSVLLLGVAVVGACVAFALISRALPIRSAS